MENEVKKEDGASINIEKGIQEIRSGYDRLCASSFPYGRIGVLSQVIGEILDLFDMCLRDEDHKKGL